MAPPNSAATAARFKSSSYRHLTCNAFTKITVVVARVRRDVWRRTHAMSIHLVSCGSHQIKTPYCRWYPSFAALRKVNMWIPLYWVYDAAHTCMIKCMDNVITFFENEDNRELEEVLEWLTLTSRYEKSESSRFLFWYSIRSVIICCNNSFNRRMNISNCPQSMWVGVHSKKGTIFPDSCCHLMGG